MTNIDQNNRPFWKQALQALAWDLLILLLLIGASEITIRFFVPSARQLIYTKNLTGGHPVVFNKLNLRNKEIHPDFSPDGVRVILVGNSVTFGSGVATADTFASQLEALLRDRQDGVKYDVINAGGQGDEMERYFTFLKKHGVGLHPKAVVLALTSNHVAAQKLPASEGKGGRGSRLSALVISLKRLLFKIHLFLFEKSYTYVVFDRLIRQSLFMVGLTRENLNKIDNNYLYAFAIDVPAIKLEKVEASYQELSRRVSELKQVLDSQGVKFMIMAIPNRFELSNLRKDNHRNVPLDKIRVIPGKRFMQIAQENGIPFMDMLPVFKEKRREMLDGKIKYDPLYIPFDTIHMNPTGHRLVAEQLEQMLVANGVIPARN